MSFEGSRESKVSSELLAHEDIFHNLARVVAAKYEKPRLADNAEIFFTTKERLPEERRQFPMAVMEARGWKFDFNLPSFRFFENACKTIYSECELAGDLRNVTSQLFIGCGLAQSIVENDLMESAGNKNNRKLMEKFFTDRTDIAALFREMFPEEPGEVDPPWSHTRHFTDRGIVRINAIRASAAYLFEAMRAAGDDRLPAIAENDSKFALAKLMNEDRFFYLEQFVFGFEKTHEQANNAFINWVPEWLIAFSLPISTDRIKYV